MLHVVFNGNDNIFTFMAAPNEYAEGTELDIIEEFLNATTGAFASFAASMNGSIEEGYDSLIDTLEDMLTDEKVNEALDAVIEDNEDGIYLNNESVEDAVTKMAYDYKESVDEFNEQMDKKLDIMNTLLAIADKDEFDKEEMVNSMINDFITLMEDLYEVDVNHVFDSSLDEFEDDLF